MSENNDKSYFYMLKIHPIEDRIMIQVDNGKIELNPKNQFKTYKLLKEHLIKTGVILG